MQSLVPKPIPCIFRCEMSIAKLRKIFITIKNENGASAVEFAILLPVLLLIIMGIIQFGLIFHNYLTMTHAAREGIRHMSLHEGDDIVVSVIKSNTPSLNQDDLDITLDPSDGTRPDGETATVSLYYPMPIDMPIIKEIIMLSDAWNSELNSLELRTAATMRIE